MPPVPTVPTAAPIPAWVGAAAVPPARPDRFTIGAPKGLYAAALGHPQLLVRPSLRGTQLRFEKNKPVPLVTNRGTEDLQRDGPAA